LKISTIQGPQIEQSFTNTPIGVRARKKRAFRDWSGVQRREQNKNSKVLEASDLRAFYKLYIIGNQWFINLIFELMYCFELGNATATETGAAEDAGRGRGRKEAGSRAGTGDA